MWLSYLLAIAVCAAMLYAPGYLLARAFPFSRFASVAIAPAFSMLLFTVLGIAAYGIVNPCHPWALFAAALAICAALFAVRRACGRKAEDLLVPRIPARDQRRLAALYVVLALAIFLVVYVLGMGDPYSFSRNDDSTVHLSLTRGFLDTGTFSTLHASSFLNQGSEGGFYPAAWHVLCALVASCFGNSVTLAFNAAITVFLVLVFPLGMLALFEKLFRGDRNVLIAGSLLTLAFCGFPWGFIVWGQLLPNLAAFIFVPVFVTVFAGIPDARRVLDRAKLMVALALGFAAIALCQPNGVFTLGILIVFYGISRLFYEPGSPTASVSAKRVLCALGVIAIACLAWVAMYRMPFMQAVVNTTWSASLSPFQALVSGPFFMFSVRQGVQPLMTLFTIVGIVSAIRSNRRYLWMVLAYLAMLALHIMGTATDGPIKQLLIGFWYTDYNRTGAMCALFAIPVASIGLARVAAWMKSLAQKKLPGKSTTWYAAAVSLVVAVAFALLQFTPIHVGYHGRQVYLSLSAIAHEIHSRYSWSNTLTSEEDAFIRKAMEQCIPEGALVINLPNDGTCWSYGVEGINTFYRRCSATGGRDDGAEAKLIRTELDEVSTNEEVRQTLENLDARYLLILDDASSDNPTKTSQRYKAEDWVGIESITPDTPGFQLLLSEGDMRLYQIEL